MTVFEQGIHARITENQKSNLPLTDEMVLPYYEGLSLVNLPGTITQLLGAPDFGAPPLDKNIIDPMSGPYDKVVVLLVDAMGYALFNRMLGSDQDIFWKRHREHAVFSPLTSVCPSTTASALTTLWTGVGPAQHGIIGYEMWAKEFGMIINNILHSAALSKGDVGGLVRAGFDPHTFLDRPLLGTHLEQHGVTASAFIHSHIAYSGLSVMQMADVDVHTFVDEADLLVSLDGANQAQSLSELVIDLTAAEFASDSGQ